MAPISVSLFLSHAIFLLLCIFIIAEPIESSNEHLISKRVSVLDSDQSISELGGTSSLPVVLPSTNASCLLFLGGIVIQVYKPNQKIKSVSNITVTRGNFRGQARCSSKDDSTNSFSIELLPSGRSIAENVDFTLDSLAFTLKIIPTLASQWLLNETIISKLSLNVVSGSSFLPSPISSLDTSTASVSKWAINSVASSSFACGRTNPAWIQPLNPEQKSSDSQYIQVGLAFKNLQIQPYGVKNGRFSSNVDDCESVIGIGAWMGILIGLLLMGIFLFGITMLNSVQTMDRFDDPKMKQININFKE